MAEIRELDVLDIWRRPPGSLDGWVRWTIAVACVATIAVPWFGARVLWDQGGASSGIPQFWFANALALVAVFGVAASFAPAWQLSRFVRLAVLLPLVHVVVIATAWPLWLYVEPKIMTIGRWDRLVLALPLAAVLAITAGIVAVAAWLVARRRRDAGWSHAFVMIGLVNLLLLGLWLPIATDLACRGTRAMELDPDLAMAHPRRLVVTAVAPPLASAIAYAALAIRSPEVARKLRGTALWLVIALLLVAVVLRADAPPAARVIYADFIPVLFAALIVAGGGVVVLGAGMYLRARRLRLRFRNRDVVEGIVRVDDGDEPVVACVEIASWLRGPRLLVRPFVLATSSGDIPIAGARLAAPIAPSTSVLRLGESVGLVRAGDAIAIAGATRNSGGDPFRTQAAAIAGDDVVIAPHAQPRFGFADVALGTWRPAIAYLVILVAVVAPALAALGTNP